MYISIRKQRIMLNKFNKIFSLHKKEQVKEGGNFNICSLLRKTNDEVNLHSKFIYELLNPSGSHSQGDKFLQLFIKEALELNIDDAINSKVIVNREDLTDVNRRIDFTIETSNYIIGIEMKIDAGDQDNQLSDYMKELRRRNSKYKQKKEIKLFYLTKFGDMPSDSSLSTLNKEDISLLSFSLDIELWLSECIKKTNITKLQESIKQYQEIIHTITGQLPKEINNKMDELIKDKNDIETLHVMTQNYTRLWAKKEVDFWNELYNRVGKMTINKKVNKDNNSIEIDLFSDKENDYKYDITYEDKIAKIVEKRHHNHYSSFGLFVDIKYKKHVFKIELYQRDNDYMYLEINLIGQRGAYKNNKVLDCLLEENNYIYSRKCIEYPELYFYAKDVTEPTFELFDDEKFSFYLTEYTKEIKKAMQLIEDNKVEIIP
ncbi:MAG: PD-(D/E)XK nuclease family protein [Aliarcobacter sp.]|nr:PD-(D/E)XK nuclease family protein [Aliarcobacter sp.]